MAGEGRRPDAGGRDHRRADRAWRRSPRPDFCPARRRQGSSARWPSATFWTAAGWRAAHRTYLTGDASARTYETVRPRRIGAVILMNAPPLVLGPPVRGGKAYAEIAHTARSVSAFVAIDRLLREAGFAVPEIFAQDLDRGFLLIENLGSETFLGRDGDADRRTLRGGRPAARRSAPAHLASARRRSRRGRCMSSRPSIARRS